MQAGSISNWLAFMALALATCVRVPFAIALEPDIQLRQIRHRAWDAAERAPVGVRVFLQAPDGRFWLGGAAGLMTFDGFHWEMPSLGAGAVRAHGVLAACSAPDGAIWLGFEAGGVARIEGRASHDFTDADGLPGGPVRRLVCDADGTIWAATDGGLAHFQEGRWSEMHLDGALPAGPVLALLKARDSAVWVATLSGVFRRGQTDSEFRKVIALRAAIDTGAQLAQSVDGVVWAGTALEGLIQFREQSGSLQPVRVSRTPTTALLVDRDGCLWIGGEGLRRSCGGGEMQTLLHADGLSGNDVRTLFEDREGNVWAATAAGLDRFSQGTFVNAMLAPELDGEKALVAGEDDELWVGDRTHDTVIRIVGEAIVERYSIPTPEIGYRDPQGRIWFAGRNGLTQVSPGPPKTWVLPPKEYSVNARAMARDAHGVLWLSVVPQGLFRFIDGQWQEGSGVRGLPTAAVTAMTTDGEGNLWLGYLTGQLVRLRDGMAEVFGERDGLKAGLIQSLYAAGPRLWIGADNALVLREGNRFFSGVATNCGSAGPITGVLEASDGELWVNRPFQFASFAGASGDIKASKPLDCAPYRADDGLPGAIQTSPIGPAFAQTRRGRLWVAAVAGLAWTNAQRVAQPVLPPSVTVAWLQSPDKADTPEGDPRFPAGTKQMDIVFNIWRLSKPDGAVYRYRVIGLDKQWRRRGRESNAVSLVNLGPGRYVFEIQAMDGRYREWGPVSSAAFVILPLFYETWWFHLFVALLALAFVGFLLRFQTRRASARVRERMEARMLERERIARELHDTLLQGLQGLMFHFQAVAEQLPRSEPAAGMMTDVLNRADAILIESRDRVSQLRESPRETSDLPATLTATARQLAQGRTLQMHTRVVGRVHPLDAAVSDELLLIAREALSNALRHAGASCIEVELGYERTGLRLTVCDDGTGIESEIMRASGRNGHFGIPGMYERARRLRGGTRISSRSPRGTEVEVRIPAAVAYARTRT